jgi:hypothetical protein
MDDLKADFEKNIHNSINRIEGFHNERACMVIDNSFPIGGSVALVNKHEQGFSCKIVMETLHDASYNQNMERFGIFEDIAMESSGYKFFIPKNSAVSINLSLSKPQVIALQLKAFQTGMPKEYNDEYFRLVIPTSHEPKFGAFECKSLKIDGTVLGCGLVPIKFGEKQFHLFKHSVRDRKEYHLIIDALQKTSLEEFKKDTDAILTGYGFVTGNLFLSEYYYHTVNPQADYRIENIAYLKKEASVFTDDSLLDSFQYHSYLENVKQLHLKDKYGLRMKLQTFSNLCQIVREEEVYSRCCQLLIEAHETKQKLLRGGILSLAIETMTNVIYEKSPERLNPIADKQVAANIQQRFRQVVDEFKNKVTDYGRSILESKINDLNRPTNSKKLSMPFKMYSIKLTEEDISVLGHRNRFLHGLSPVDSMTAGDKDIELSYIVAKLEVLLVKLMLKYVGYNGHIVNKPAWVRYNTKQELTEHLFVVI